MAASVAAGTDKESIPSPSVSARPQLPTYVPSPRPSWSCIAKSLFAGGIAGGLSRTAVAPLERLKILMQVQGNDKIYKSTWQGLVQMAKAGGMREMMRGNGANCIRIIPNSAVKFLTYEHISREIADYNRATTGKGEMTPFLRLLAGAGAGIIAMSATYPLDMEGPIAVYSGWVPSVEGPIASDKCWVPSVEGPKALYKGWVPSVVGVIPYVGLNFAVYETLKASMLQHYGLRDERDLSVGARLGCGALAGTTGQTVAYPFDVARRRLQVSGWKGAEKLHADQGKSVVYKGMIDCFGLAPNYIKRPPNLPTPSYTSPLHPRNPRAPS
eukprot:gene8579-34015_t